MLPQLGFAEILVLSLLAIIVVGPKDLPKLMRKIGQIMTKVRAMGQEFTNAFNEMGAEDEIAEMRKELADLRKMGSMDHLSEKFEGEIEAIDRDLRGAMTNSTHEAGNPEVSQSTETGKADKASEPKPSPKEKQSPKTKQASKAKKSSKSPSSKAKPTSKLKASTKPASKTEKSP
jgi:sec-independent protein translocase protein TatB